MSSKPESSERNVVAKPANHSSPAPTPNVKKQNKGWWILLATILLYGGMYFYDDSLTLAALQHFIALLKTLAPILFVVMIFMWVLDVLVNPKLIKKYMGHESGWTGWSISIVAGVLSHGPVYAWYPLLQSLQQQGTRPALIATFLYARSIKLPWLPMLAFYFGTTYMLLFTIFLTLFAPIVGLLTERSEWHACDQT